MGQAKREHRQASDVALVSDASEPVDQSLQSPLEQPCRPGRLSGKVALITDGAGGIGRALAAALVREGADVAVQTGGGTDEEDFCRAAVERTLEAFGRIDILVNGADRAGIHRCFHMTKFALPHMRAGASIINAAPPADGAVASFMHAVSLALSEKGIRVDALAPDGGVVLNS